MKSIRSLAKAVVKILRYIPWPAAVIVIVIIFRKPLAALLTIDLVRGLGKFIVDIIHYAAWPATVFGVIYIFRNAITNKIESMTGAHGKKGDAEWALDFAETVALATGTTQEQPQAIPFAHLTEDNLNWPTALNLMASSVVLTLLYLNAEDAELMANNASAYRETLPGIARIISAFRDHWPENVLRVVDHHFPYTQQRLSRIFDNPS